MRYAPLTLTTPASLIPPEIAADITLLDEGVDEIDPGRIDADLVGGTRQAEVPNAAYFSVGDVLHLLWGGQSCPQRLFGRLFPDVSEPSRGKGRLKAGCSQDWLPHNSGRDGLQDQKVRGIRQKCLRHGLPH